MSAERLHVAFADIGNPDWAAGATYYENLFHALNQLDDAPRTSIVLWPHAKSAPPERYRDVVDSVIEIPVPPRPSTAVRVLERVRRAAGVTPRLDCVEAVLRDRGVDALFACWMELGSTFRLPLLGWIPDFQHVHLPELFTSEENLARDDLFTRMAANCARVVLSSHDARIDFERFSPAHAHKARVLQFVAQVPPSVYDDDPRGVCDEFGLPERFFYLPNQFWAHKNHRLVLEALATVKKVRPDIAVVCTGNVSDNRDPRFVGELLAHVSRLGLRDNFIIAGWVPRLATFAFMRQSIAALQPSLFEGWSTSVEESKTLGKTILVSDIPIHREQDPIGAVYFDPNDATSLGKHLVDAFDNRAPGPDLAMEQAAREALPLRTRAFARTFVDIATEPSVARV